MVDVGFAYLALAVGAFVGLHVGIAGTRLRARLIGRLGAARYRGIFALATLAPLVATIVAYRAAPVVPLWDVGSWRGLPPAVAAIISLIFIVASAMAPNPTSSGQIDAIAGELPVIGAVRITRNPQLWAIGLLMAAHLAVVGDLASLILFGGLTTLAIGGSFSLDRRLAAQGGARWSRFAAVTSNVPFAAILAGRQTLVLREIPARAYLLAFALFLIISAVHPRWI